MQVEAKVSGIPLWKAATVQRKTDGLLRQTLSYSSLTSLVHGDGPGSDIIVNLFL